MGWRFEQSDLWTFHCVRRNVMPGGKTAKMITHVSRCGPESLTGLQVSWSDFLKTSCSHVVLQSVKIIQTEQNYMPKAYLCNKIKKMQTMPDIQTFNCLPVRPRLTTVSYSWQLYFLFCLDFGFGSHILVCNFTLDNWPFVMNFERSCFSPAVKKTCISKLAL